VFLAAVKSLQYRWAKRDSQRFVRWLRRRGCRVGEGVEFHGLQHISIDTTRPSLVEIGNNVVFTRGCVLLTHGYDWFVLRNLRGKVLCSSGRVRIGDNVFLGVNCVVLQGVTIGDNVILGAGSVVTRDIPSNSVAVGNPARVLCSIEEYCAKRETEYVEEAKEYARSIKENLRRDPVPADFWEEFPLFLKADETPEGVPVKRQLGCSYEEYRRTHRPRYESFTAFLEDAGVTSGGDGS